MIRILDDGTIADVVWDGRGALTPDYESIGCAALQMITDAPELTAQGNRNSERQRENNHKRAYFKDHSRRAYHRKKSWML